MRILATKGMKSKRILRFRKTSFNIMKIMLSFDRLKLRLLKFGFEKVPPRITLMISGIYETIIRQIGSTKRIKSVNPRSGSEFSTENTDIVSPILSVVVIILGSSCLVGTFSASIGFVLDFEVDVCIFGEFSFFVSISHNFICERESNEIYTRCAFVVKNCQNFNLKCFGFSGIDPLNL